MLTIIATGYMIPAYFNVLEIKQDMATQNERQAICQHLQLLCLKQVKMQMVNGAFQFASIDTVNGPSMVALSGHSELES